MRTIEIVVSPDGIAQVETKGFAGSSCREASHFVEAALGLRIHESLTAEYYHSESRQQAEERQS